MGDRTSSIQVGDFILHTDRDHRGSFRGNQAMGKTWRQWHFHVDSEKYPQQQIMHLCEVYLHEIHAIPLQQRHFAIGNLEPASMISAWEKEGKTVVLWISSYNGKLHIEANKTDFNAKALLSKRELIRILTNKRFS